MERYAIITAGGIGSRMESELPKQFMEIEGKPILRRTMELFLSLPFKVNIIVVINGDYKEYWKEYCRNHDFIFPSILTAGGLTRFHSVKKGVGYLPEGAIVAVHDGVRPFVSKELILSLYEKCEKEGAVIPVIRAIDSMREVVEGGTKVVDRDNYLMIQTPQVFRSDILIKSYKQAYNPSFTDDASVVERAGYRLTFCDGEKRNIKITTADDIKFAKAVISLGGL